MGQTIKIFLLLFISNALWAQPADPTSKTNKFNGDWSGEIELPNEAELGVIFTVGGTPAAMTCKMNVPAQGGGDVPAQKIYTEGNTLFIDYPSLKAKYKGTLSGEVIQGVWAQNGMEFPLQLKPFHGKEAVVRMQTPKAPFEYDITEIEMMIGSKSGQHQLSGTMTTPKGEGPFPLAILVSGSGPQDRDETIFEHKPFWVIADYLTNNGIAVLRYDDRGVGKSTGTFEGATTKDFLADALFLVNAMGSYPKVDTDKIGIIGHSEGGLIAAMAAAESSKVKFSVMLAGPGVPGIQLLKKQLKQTQEAEGVDEELLEKEGNAMSDVVDIAAGEGNSSAREAKAKKRLQSFFENNLSTEEKEQYNGDFNLYFQSKTAGLFTDWMQYFLNIEPKVYLERISCPTLALIGSKDLQVAALDNIPALRAALKAAPTEDFVVEVIPGVNHLFQHTKTGKVSEYGMLPETFANEALVMMRDWISKL